METENLSGVWKVQLLLGEGENLAVLWLLRALGPSWCQGAEAAGEAGSAGRHLAEVGVPGHSCFCGVTDLHVHSVSDFRCCCLQVTLSPPVLALGWNCGCWSGVWTALRGTNLFSLGC